MNEINRHVRHCIRSLEASGNKPMGRRLDDPTLTDMPVLVQQTMHAVAATLCKAGYEAWVDFTGDCVHVDTTPDAGRPIDHLTLWFERNNTAWTPNGDLDFTNPEVWATLTMWLKPHSTPEQLQKLKWG